MKHILLLTGVLIAMNHLAVARVWRVNNDPTKSADFAIINDAIAAAADGDTIYIEPSATAYPSVNVNKRLTLLGNGYFLGGTNLQANSDSSVVISIIVDSSSTTTNGSGSFIAGLTINTGFTFLHNVHDVTLTRCNVRGQITYTAFDRTADNLEISKCFIESHIAAGFVTAMVNTTIQYNIFSAATGATQAFTNLPGTMTGIFRNNTINTSAPEITLNSFYIANNVSIHEDLAAITGSNNIFRNNSFAAPTVTGITDGADGNHTNVSMLTLFAGSSSAGYGDTRFRTAGAGVLRGTGETIGGVTPDRGAWNTVAATDSYRASGIPPIPTLYKLAAPVSVDPAATSINVTISARANN